MLGCLSFPCGVCRRDVRFLLAIVFACVSGAHAQPLFEPSSSCAASDLRKWHTLAHDPSDPVLEHLGAIFRACGVFFLSPDWLGSSLLSHLHAAASKFSSQQVNADAGPSEAIVHPGPFLRDGRRMWWPSPQIPEFGHALLDVLAVVGKLLSVAWRGRRVGLDFVSVLETLVGGKEQRLHVDSSSSFAKLQLALHSHGDEHGALRFQVQNRTDVDALSRCSASAENSAFVRQGGADTCARYESVAIRLPGGAAAAGAMILYLGNVLHGGLANIAMSSKIVVDTSFRRGSPRHQSDLPQSAMGSGLLKCSPQSLKEEDRVACVWNEIRQKQWRELGQWTQ